MGRCFENVAGVMIDTDWSLQIVVAKSIVAWSTCYSLKQNLLREPWLHAKRPSSRRNNSASLLYKQVPLPCNKGKVSRYGAVGVVSLSFPMGHSPLSSLAERRS